MYNVLKKNYIYIEFLLTYKFIFYHTYCIHMMLMYIENKQFDIESIQYSIYTKLLQDIYFILCDS